MSPRPLMSLTGPRRTFFWAVLAALVGIVAASGDASACLLRRRAQARTVQVVYVTSAPAAKVRPPAEKIPPPKVQKGAEKIPAPKDGEPIK